MSQDFAQLLLACMDPPKQSTMLQVLSDAESSNISEYLRHCLEVLKDSRQNVSVRQLAGILLKNAIGTGNNGLRDRMLSERWSTEVPETIRAYIRTSLLEVVAQPSTVFEARRAAELGIARIAAIELPRGCWPEFVPSLLTLLQSCQQSPGAAEAALAVMGHVAEDWYSRFVVANDVQHVVDAMLNAIICVLSNEQLPICMSLQALRSFERLAFFASQNSFANVSGGAANFLSGILRHCKAESSDDIRCAAFTCLARFGVECYAQLNPGALETALMSTCSAVRNGPESVALQALEFWDVLAQHETKLLRDDSTRESCFLLTRKAFPALFPIFCFALGTDNEDAESTSPADVASCALASVAMCIVDDCVGPVLAFVELNVASQDISFCQAALLAYGSILEGPSKSRMQPLVQASLPKVVEALRSSHTRVAIAAAWVVGRVLEVHPISVLDEHQATLFQICIQRLQASITEPQMITQICYCLDGLVKHAVLTPSLFPEIALTVFQATSKAELPEVVRSSLYVSLAGILELAFVDNYPLLQTILFELLLAAESAGASPPDGLGTCIRVITRRLGKGVANSAGQMLELYVKILQAHHNRFGGIHEEMLLAVSGLIKALGAQFEVGIQRLWPILEHTLKESDDSKACLAALAATKDISSTLGDAFFRYSEPTFNILSSLLRGPDIDHKVRVAVVDCIASVAAALGPEAPCLPAVFALLAEASSQLVNQSRAGQAKGKGMNEWSVTGKGEGKSRKKGKSKALSSRIQDEWLYRKDLLEAFLSAYLLIVCEYHKSSAWKRFPLEGLPWLLEFVCFCVGRPWAGNDVLSMATRILGMLATNQELQKHLVPHFRQEPSAGIMKKLAAFAADSKDKEVRGLSQVLRNLSPEV